MGVIDQFRSVQRRARKLDTEASVSILARAAAKTGRPAAKPESDKPRAAAKSIATTDNSVFFETLEPRLLLSADIVPIDGRIDLPGEEDAYVFTLTEEASVHVNALTDGPFDWRLENAEGENLGGQTAVATNGRQIAGPSRYDLAAGSYTFTVGGIGEATGDYRFQISDLSEATPLSSGASTEDTLASGFETHVYSLDVAVGERIEIDVEDLTGLGRFDVGFRILDPFGQEVLDLWDFRASASPASTTTEILSRAGTYTLLLEADKRIDVPASYRFTATRLAADTVDLPLGNTAFTLNTPIAGRIETEGQQDTFAFDVAEAGYYLFDSRIYSSTVAATLEDSIGRTLIENYRLWNGDALLFLTAGRHVLTLEGHNDTGIGDYDFAVQRIADSAALNFGDTIAGTLDPAPETHAYTVALAAGDTVMVERQLPTFASSGVRWSLFDPAGRTIETSTNGLSRTTAATTGTYILLVRGSDSGTTPVDYRFRIDRVADQSSPLEIGEIYSGTVPTAARHTYAFDVVEDGLFLFDAMSLENARWTLTGANGVVMNDTYLSTGQFYPIRLALPKGAYTLAIRGHSDAEVDYRFRILDTADATPVSSDTPVTVNIDEIGGAALFRLDASDGDVFSFRPLTTGLGYLGIFNASGESVTNNSITTTGPHRVVGDAPIFLTVKQWPGRTAPLSLTFVLDDVSLTEQDLTFGTIYEADLERRGSVQRYNFTLDTPRTVFFDTLFSGTSSARFSLSGADGFVRESAFADRYGANNLIPLQAGNYSLDLFMNSTAKGTVPFRLLDADAVPTLEKNTEVTIDLDPISGSAIRKVEIEAGEALYFSRGARNGGANPDLRLFGPSGDQVWDGGSVDVATRLYTRPGTYTLVIEGLISASRTDAGSMDVGVWTVRDSVTPLALGMLVTGAVERAGETPTYTFDLAAPSLLHFDSLTNDGNLSWAIYDADTGVRFAGQDFNDQVSDREAVFELPAASYRLVVEGTRSHRGPFQFRVSDIGSGSAVTLDTDITASFPEGEDSAFFTVDLSAGQIIGFDAGALPGGASTGSYRFRLFDPHGNETVSRSWRDLDDIVIQASGIHAIVIDSDHNVSVPSTVIFRLDDLGPAIPKLLDGEVFVPGEVVEGAIDVPDGTSGHLFTLDRTTRLVIDSLTNSNRLFYVIEDGFGERMTPRAFSSNDHTDYSGVSVDDPIFITLEAGTYRLSTFSTFGEIGSYAFRLIDLDDPAIGPVLERDVPVTATIDPGNQSAFFRFSGTAGEALSFRDRTFADISSSLATVLIYGPGGEIVPINGSDTDTLSGTSKFTLPRTGDYVLAIMGRNSVTTPYAIGFTLEAAARPDIPLALDTQVSGTLSNRDAIVRYQFTLDEQRLLLLDSQTTLSNIEWRILAGDRQIAGGTDLSVLSTVADGLLSLGPGDYVLEITNDFDRLGDYAFVLRDVAASAQDAVIGTPFTFAPTEPQSASIARFTGAQGRYYLDTVSETMPSSPDLVVVREDGSIVGDYWVSSADDLGAIDLEDGARYYVIINTAMGWETVGTATFNVDAVDRTVVPLAFDTLTVGAIEKPGDTIVYEVTIPEPGFYYLDSRTSDSRFTYTLRDRVGQVFTVSSNSESGSNALLRLAAGTYELELDGSTSSVGEVRFQLASPASATPVALGSYLDVALSPGSETRMFTFEGEAGTRLYLEALQAVGSANRSIFDPFGRKIDDAGFWRDIDGLPLAVSGTYVMVVGGAANRVDPSTFAYNLVAVRIAPAFGVDPAAPGANLIVSDLAVSAAGPVRAGAPVTLTWTTRNDGVAPAAPFIERIVVRNEDLGGIIAVLDVPYEAEPFAAGGSVSRSAVIDLPPGNPGSGALTFRVISDATNTILEPSADGTTESDDAVLAVQSAVDTLPDLIIENIEVSPPTDWRPGDTVTVSWTTRNGGGLPADTVWTEQLRIRNTLRGVEVALEELAYDGTAATGTPLGAGESAARSIQITLPENLNVVGAFAFTVTTDTGDTILEANETDTGETNNSTQANVVSAPNLIVRDIRLQEPDPIAGGDLTIVWDIENIGPGATLQGFSDRIRIYNYDLRQYVFNADLAYDHVSLGPLEAGASATRQLAIQLPDGARGAGALEVFVETNRTANGSWTLYETLPNGNLGIFDNRGSLAFTSEERTYANLR
ncbi:MAG: CARDB domain-containing protein, partial [Pseudomonadota bacterium]